MLPRTYFERISLAYRLRTAVSPRERRRTIRADLRRASQMAALTSGNVTDVQKVRVREISMGGCSIMLSKRMRVGDDFLLCLNTPRSEKFWIWCRVGRCVELDRLFFVVGCNFIRALFPGQTLQHGTNARNLLWFGVEGGVEPPDPFILAA